MQKLSLAERRALVERKPGERQALEKKLSELCQKRAAFLAEAARKGKCDAFAPGSPMLCAPKPPESGSPYNNQRARARARARIASASGLAGEHPRNPGGGSAP